MGLSVDAIDHLAKSKYELTEEWLNGQEQTLTSSRLFEIFEKPIQLAKNSNLLRDDFCCEKDLLILISMVGGAVAYVQMSGQSAIERTLELLMNGIKVVTKE